MTKIHKAVCDRCGKEEELVHTNGYYFYTSFFELPKGWSEIRDKTFCKGCTKDYKDYVEKFK